MSKVFSLCIIFSLLLLLTSHRIMARPEPKFHDVTPTEPHGGDNEVEKMGLAEERPCDGVGEDECMMRRTLEAHLDYIYTQKQKQP